MFGVVMLIAAIGPSAARDGQADSGGLLQILVGVVFLVLAIGQWRKRPRPGAEAELPAWMNSLGEASALRAFGVGALLGSLNPKNLGLNVTAGTVIGTADLSLSGRSVVALVFTLVGSIAVATPVLLFALAEERARPMLQNGKEWLVQNSATVMSVLFTVLGVQTLGQGIAGMS